MLPLEDLELIWQCQQRTPRTLLRIAAISIPGSQCSQTLVPAPDNVPATKGKILYVKNEAECLMLPCYC